MNTYILPFWKKIGTSSSIISKRVSEKLNIPTSHTGTLDPLAEGVIKIIVGDESRNKEKFISEDKTYSFKFLLGFSTDTHDALGLIEKTYLRENIEEENIIFQINSFLGVYNQKYPNFSSKKVLGKSLWQYFRDVQEVPQVFINGEIKKIDIKNIQKLKREAVLSKIYSQINQIQGNFRQKEILQRYSESQFPDEFLIIEVSMVMTRGLYVRGLARDLEDKTGIPCIILDLIRIADGSTEKKDCLIPEEYFKEEILKNQNFLYPDFINL